MTMTKASLATELGKKLVASFVSDQAELKCYAEKLELAKTYYTCEVTGRPVIQYISNREAVGDWYGLTVLTQAQVNKLIATAIKGSSEASFMHQAERVKQLHSQLAADRLAYERAQAIIEEAKRLTCKANEFMRKADELHREASRIITGLTK